MLKALEKKKQEKHNNEKIIVVRPLKKRVIEDIEESDENIASNLSPCMLNTLRKR